MEDVEEGEHRADASPLHRLEDLMLGVGCVADAADAAGCADAGGGPRSCCLGLLRGLPVAVARRSELLPASKNVNYKRRFCRGPGQTCPLDLL